MKRRMARGFVQDVRRRRVQEVLDAAHIEGDHQHPQGLELHEDRRGDEAVDHHGAPAERSRQAFISSMDGI
jgi:hypothetical protein